MASGAEGGGQARARARATSSEYYSGRNGTATGVPFGHRCALVCPRRRRGTRLHSLYLIRTSAPTTTMSIATV